MFVHDPFYGYCTSQLTAYSPRRFYVCGRMFENIFSHRTLFHGEVSDHDDEDSLAARQSFCFFTASMAIIRWQRTIVFLLGHQPEGYGRKSEKRDGTSPNEAKCTDVHVYPGQHVEWMPFTATRSLFLLRLEVETAFI